MSFNDDESKMAANIIVVFSLFVVVPCTYILDIYMLYRMYIEKTDISIWSVRETFGFCILMFGAPIFHWLGYKYCQENFGWFRKK